MFRYMKLTVTEQQTMSILIKQRRICNAEITNKTLLRDLR